MEIKDKGKQIMQSFISKKTLYVLCFMALNLIEILRGSQPGNIWKVAANCTGLVMMVVIFSAYPLKEFLTRGNAIYVSLCGIAMVAVHIYWQLHEGTFLWGETQTAILNICWIGIIVRHLFNKVIVEKKISFRPGLMGWLWIALFVLMIVSVSERWWPIWFLLMFGSFYLTDYKPEDRKALWDGMIDGTILSFFLVQIYAYGFRPYDEVRYVGAFANTNATALYYLIIYMMCLYKLHLLELKGAKKAGKLIYLLGAGGMLSFQLFTMCRTAWVVSFVVTVLYGIFVVRKLWNKKWYQVICRGGALVLAAMITFLPVFYTIRWLPTVLHYRVWYEGEYDIDKVHSYDPPNSEKYVELDEFLEALLGRIINTLKNADAHNPFVLQAKAAEIEMERVELVDVPWTDDLSLRQRLTIYKAYWDDLTWFGHGMKDGYYLIGDGDYHSFHAQNLWLQIAYTYGIIPGMLSIVLSVVLLYKHGKVALRKKGNPYAIIPFFVCVAYMVFGLMEIVWNPGQLIMFLMFFVQHPQMRSCTKQLEEK